MFARFLTALRRGKRLLHEMEGSSFRIRNEVVAQKRLMLAYQQIASDVRLSFRSVGFGLYSQHDEDGILLYIFSRIGVHTYKAVEMCAGNGCECNVANLLINHR